MKAMSARITKGISVGTVLKCADNTGAKELIVISVRGFKGRRRTKPSAGVGSIVNVTLRSGVQKLMHEVHKAVIIRQRKEYRRANGLRVKFEDNAAILVDDKFEPRGTLIKGPVAREVVERFSTIGKIASLVV